MAHNAAGIISDAKACYAAFKAHDVRFDGRLFICVASTGIYCRPVCRVKRPKEANCSFQPSAAAAEMAGYRPCLKCRPELAPGLAPVDSSTFLARKAALRIEDDCLSESGLAQLADSLGVTDRHLRRVFSAAYGVPPVRYLQTRRLLLAKSLLADTSLPVTEIAFAAGFGSVRRFNDLFKKHYRLAPSALRKVGRGAAAPGDGEGARVHLGYRPPYGWNALLSFLDGRAIPGVESVGGGAYRRTVAMRHGGETRYGWISVANDEKRNALAITLSPSLLPVLPKVLARVRLQFDLDSDPQEISAALSVMNEWRPSLFVPGTRVPGCFDPFEMAARAVLGQQITVKAARTLAGRLANAFGDKVETPFDNLAIAFPTPERILALDGPIEGHFGPLGIIGARARSIAGLARSMAEGRVTLSPTADVEREMRALLELPGFGKWTVEYLAMRALGWPDAFPHTDYGVRKAMGGMNDSRMLEMAEQWRPWRSYATMSLWNSLG